VQSFTLKAGTNSPVAKPDFTGSAAITTPAIASTANTDAITNFFIEHSLGEQKTDNATQNS
jgi:hypothetical protein